MSFIDCDLAVIYDGPLAEDVTGPAGVIRGFVDVADEENWRIGDFGRHQTRLDRRFVLRIRTDDLGTIARDGTVSIAEGRFAATYRVQDLRLQADGRETELYVVALK